MAHSLLSLVFFLLLPNLALPTRATTNLDHQQSHKPGLKSVHLTVYVHETFNKTSYLIVKGVTSPNQIVPRISYPFGSLFSFNDPLNETPNPSSNLLGYMEGSAVTTSFDGGRMICTIRTSLNMKGYKGELLNVGTCHFTQATELPIVGGTGDFTHFRFVQGYMIATPVDVKSPTTCYKIEFQLYWPPYVALIH